MRGLERVGDLDAEPEDGVDRQRLAADQLLQVLALQHFHHDVVLKALGVFGGADVVNGADVRVCERRGGARLALKPLHGVRVRRELAGQELQRDATPEPLVVGRIHHAHAAAAQPFDDAVVRNRPAHHESGGMLPERRRPCSTSWPAASGLVPGKWCSRGGPST